MSKIVLFASILAASLISVAVPSQARQISVWGNTFTTDDGTSLAGAASSGQFRATVDHPERYSRGPRHIGNLAR